MIIHDSPIQTATAVDRLVLKSASTSCLTRSSVQQKRPCWPSDCCEVGVSHTARVVFDGEEPDNCQEAAKVEGGQVGSGVEDPRPP